MAPSCGVIPPTVSLNIFTPVSVPLPGKRPPSASTGNPASTATTVGTKDSSICATPNGGGSDAAAVAKTPSAGEGPSKPKKEKKKKVKKEGGEEGKGGETPPPAPQSDEGDPSKLDVRVGVIVKAWEHTDSEKLFCEEIDLGEVSEGFDKDEILDFALKGTRVNG